MTNLMKLVTNNYNEILDPNRDPIIDTWPLMASPGPILCILATYLLFVLKVGPKMMEKRPPFQLKTPLIIYNGFEVLFSIWLSSWVFRTDSIRHIFSLDCNLTKHTRRDPELSRILLGSAWWYHVSKIIELLDTVFFVLRKKQNQVTFLHVYHHTITALFTWCYLKFLPGEQGILLGFLNSVVHIIMYSYYFIAALGPQYRKYLWWKKYMTWLQLVQFITMLGYLIVISTMDCGMSKALTYFFVINVVIFIYLFADFYLKTYKKRKNAVPKEEKCAQD